MTKKYVFLHRLITNVGGGEIYTCNKVKYLEEKGYEVIVFSTSYGKIYIDELSRFERYIIPELVFNPFLYTEKRRNQIVNELASLIGVNEKSEVIIESHNYPLDFWGEILARKIGVQNFIFCIDDNFKRKSYSQIDFYLFKLKRKELVGIHNASLQLLFGNNYTLSQEEHYHLNFSCYNSISNDCKDLFFLENVKNYDIKLATISRIEKPSVEKICEEIKNFALNTDKKILYVIFGGTNDKKKLKQAKRIFQNIKNVDFYITGFIYPISYNDVQKFDLFISIAGSAWATYLVGIPTLTVELDTGSPLGILGYNTYDWQYKTQNNNDNWNTIEEVLYKLFNERNPDLNMIREIKKCNFNIDFDEHLDFVNRRPIDYKKDYMISYDDKEKIKSYFLKFVSSFFKKKVFFKVISFFRILSSVF